MQTTMDRLAEELRGAETGPSITPDDRRGRDNPKPP